MILVLRKRSAKYRSWSQNECKYVWKEMSKLTCHAGVYAGGGRGCSDKASACARFSSVNFFIAAVLEREAARALPIPTPRPAELVDVMVEDVAKERRAL